MVGVLGAHALKGKKTAFQTCGQPVPGDVYR